LDSLPSLGGGSDRRTCARMMRGRTLLIAILACCAAGLAVLPAMAQQQPGGWQSETLRPGQVLPGTQQGAQQGGQQGLQQGTQGLGGTPAQTQQDLFPNTTVVPRTRGEPKSGGIGQVSLQAMLTEDGQGIEQGLVWRVYRDIAGPDGKARPVSTSREASPTLKLDAGDYFVNVALGRANLTRKITVLGDRASQERFVLNAGGLRLVAVLGKGEVANERAVSYDIFSDERDQYGQRVRIMSALRPGTVVRLNAGIYSIVSTYGDANAVARSDVTVEAGKLTEARLNHPAASVTLKLVTRSGGDAIADTQWSIATASGESVKESVGALPTHILAPGTYVVSARHAGQVYQREFSVKAGDFGQVEVVMR
ncbi:MAG: hypothetical protein ABWY63_08960, partial [Hyphomicrobiaceae bacterium]